MAEKTIGVDGMTCMGCVGALQGKLMSEPGIHRALVSLQDHSATVDYDPDAVSDARLEEIVRETGFEPRAAE